jgi:GntR family transcriptional regulator, vanillate catabolism transcriptional regulator
VTSKASERRPQEASGLLGGVLGPSKVSLVSQVVAGLRDMVFNGRLEQGTKLLQEQLASELKVSRTPLREAIGILVSEGLLVPVPGSGNGTVKVLELTADDVAELYQVREMIDGLAARLCATRQLDALWRARLQGAFDDFAEACEPFDLTAYVTAHAQFHVEILRACGNTRLLQMESLVRLSAEMLFRRFAGRGHEMKRSIPAHQSILRAILEGDASRAEELARSHICGAADRWVPILRSEEEQSE